MGNAFGGNHPARRARTVQDSRVPIRTAQRQAFTITRIVVALQAARASVLDLLYTAPLPLKPGRIAYPTKKVRTRKHPSIIRQRSTTMGRIVGVHGIANTFYGSARLTDEWFKALHGGLEEARAPALQVEDLAVVAYGALFRRDPDGNERRPTHRGLRGPQAFEATEDWERDLIDGWWRAASALSAENRKTGGGDESGEDPGIQGPDFEGRARAPQILQRGLLQLAKSRFFRPFGPSVLISELRQVRHSLHDPDFKQAILERFASKITAETRVIIGHSLGSVVAYEALCAHPEWQIDTFVTLGSPLGIPNVVFDALVPKPERGIGMWPHVARWVNIADKGDLVALVKTLAPLFRREQWEVQDVLVHNGWKSHDVTRYLAAVETGQAVASALKQGGRGGRSAIAAG